MGEKAEEAARWRRGGQGGGVRECGGIGGAVGGTGGETLGSYSNLGRNSA